MKNDVKLIRYCPWNLNCSHFYAYGRVNEGSGGKPLQEGVWIDCLSVLVTQSVKRSPQADLCVCKRKVQNSEFSRSADYQVILFIEELTNNY